MMKVGMADFLSDVSKLVQLMKIYISPVRGNLVCSHGTDISSTDRSSGSNLPL